MSTNLALVDPAVVPSRAPRPDRQHRPELVEVTPTAAQRRARPRIGYAVVAVAALGILLLAQLGIIVGLGVLLDTVVVRGVVTPALVALCGRHFWWPGRLSREHAETSR